MADNNELAVVLRLVADQFKTELQSSRGAIGAFNDFLKDWKTQLAAAGTALFAVAKSTADFGEEALKTSQRRGTTVEITTALQYAAHMADVPIGTLEKGLKTLAQAAVQASSGSGDGAKLFTQLGLSATDATGKRHLEQLVADALCNRTPLAGGLVDAPRAHAMRARMSTSADARIRDCRRHTHGRLVGPNDPAHGAGRRGPRPSMPTRRTHPRPGHRRR